jgi:hypothetical protein
MVLLIENTLLFQHSANPTSGCLNRQVTLYKTCVSILRNENIPLGSCGISVIKGNSVASVG